MKLKVYLEAIRIKNIAKNIVIFLPFLFSGGFLENFDIQLTLNLLKTCLLFFFISGIVYLFNDIQDMEEDKQHPVKKLRPIPSGQVSKSEINLLVIVLFLLFIFFLFTLNETNRTYIFILCLIYLILNIFYSKFIKKWSYLVGSIFVSSGFFIRLLLGASVAEINLKIWLVSLLIISSFFISILKKYSDSENKSRFQYRIIFFTGLVIAITYCIHFQFEIGYENYFVLSISNSLLAIYIIFRAFKTFTLNNSHNDPVEYFLQLPNLVLNSFWFLSYIYLRYIL